MPDPASVIRPIKASLRHLVLATVVLYLALGALGAKTFVDARANLDALCALRVDLEKRVETSQKFLDEHPEGLVGISVETIQDGIDNQEQTIAALGALSCGAPI